MDTQESLCFVLDKYVLRLRSKHTREQAKTFIDAARTKHGSRRQACCVLAFSTPGVADLYADMEARRAKDALKARPTRQTSLPSLPRPRSLPLQPTLSVPVDAL